MRRTAAEKLFEEHPDAAQLFNGMDPLDVMREGITEDNYPCQLVKEK